MAPHGGGLGVITQVTPPDPNFGKSKRQRTRATAQLRIMATQPQGLWGRSSPVLGGKGTGGPAPWQCWGNCGCPRGADSRRGGACRYTTPRDATPSPQVRPRWLWRSVGQLGAPPARLLERCRGLERHSGSGRGAHAHKVRSSEGLQPVFAYGNGPRNPLGPDQARAIRWAGFS